MSQPDWVPADLDVNVPSIARSYDYLLGGSHNFAADREYSRQVLAVLPDARLVAQANRAFMHRAVRFMIAQGVRQFLDIGSGIPTVGNVHEIAQRTAPGSRVLYVDIDPVAVAHSQQILAGNPDARVIREDVRNPEAILDHPHASELLDFSEPLGVLLVAVLHAVPDTDDPSGLLARLLRRVRPGSFLALSHGTADARPAEANRVAGMSARTTTPVTMRPLAEVEKFFAGTELLPPGLVWAPAWRPDAPEDAVDAQRASIYAGVGRVL